MSTEHLSLTTLNLYLDQALDAETRAAVEAHLAVCVQCKREFDALRGVFTALDALPAERIPVDIAPRVLAQIHATPLRSPLAKVVLAAQFAFAALLGIWLAPLLAGQSLSVPPPNFAAALNVLTGLNTSYVEINPWLDSLASTGELFSRSPLGGISILEWLGVIVVLGLIWLAGNRWLLANIKPTRNHSEVLQ